MNDSVIFSNIWVCWSYTELVEFEITPFCTTQEVDCKMNNKDQKQKCLMEVINLKSATHQTWT